MPQIPLAIGQMDLESDKTSKKDTVLAHLYNGYRVGQAIHAWPELVELCNLGTGEPAYVWASVLHGKTFAVSGGRLFLLNKSVNWEALEMNGQWLDASVPPTFTEDAHNVFVAAKSPIYRITLTGIVLAVQLASEQAPVNVTSLAYVSGFLIANGDDPLGGGLAGDFAFSDTQGDDGIPTYANWSYENNASKPDALQAIVATTDENLYCIGTESVDVNYISGNVENPFAPNKAAAQPFGTPSPSSIAYDSESIYMVAVANGNRYIGRLVGGRTPQVIGFPVGVPVNKIADVSKAKGQIVGFEGQTFYVITFPDANIAIDDSFHKTLTLAFNIRAQEWSIVGDWDGDRGEYVAWRAMSFAYDRSTRFVGGSDGKVYTFSTETRADEPVMLHRWRNDGKLEWGNPRNVPLGKLGERTFPQRSHQCGTYTQRQDEFIFSGPVRMAIRTGWRNWGKSVPKRCNEYIYDVKRGDTGIVFNGVEENMQALR